MTGIRRVLDWLRLNRGHSQLLSSGPVGAGGAVSQMPDLQVDEPLCIVADLHGCAPLLEKLLALRRERFADHRLVVLGDMIDRGEQSATVLHLLQGCEGAICLMGNHEAMMLAALDDPAGRAPDWLRHGGLTTLSSFGLRGIPVGSAGMQTAMAELREAMGAETEAWLRALPLWWQSGNLLMCHAGADPAMAPEEQVPRSLLWGHPAFLRDDRRDGLHVAHGHYIVEQALQNRGRLSLDTGAYATGVLSYALISPTGSRPGHALFKTLF